MTSLVATQAAIEVWASDSSAMVATQAALETWAYSTDNFFVTQVALETWASATTTNFMVATQAVLEVWASSETLYFQKSRLWQSDVTPSGDSTYTEAGNTIEWSWTTVLLPDNLMMKENRVIETNITMEFIGSGPSVSIEASDNDGNLLGALTITPSGTDTLWDEFLWDDAAWDGSGTDLFPFRLDWTDELVFKQAVMAVSGVSQTGFRIGNLYMNYQILGYHQQTPQGGT